MGWLNPREAGIPAGLAEWATSFSSSVEARAACDRADWLFWLLSAEATSDHLQRVVVGGGVAAIEFSPGLARRASHVAAAHIWSAPVPEDRPPRSFQRPLFWSAALATVVVALGDFFVSPNVSAFSKPPNGLWLRCGVVLAVWCVLITVLQPWFERNAVRKV